MNLERTTSLNPDLETFVAQTNEFLAHSEDVLKEMNADIEQLGDIQAIDSASEGNVAQHSAAMLKTGIDALFQSTVLLSGLY